MGVLTPEDQAIRRRIAAWLKYFYLVREQVYKTRENFAKRIHVPKSTISDVFNNKEDIGIGVNVLINMRRYLHADINLVIDEDPPMQATGESRTAP